MVICWRGFLSIIHFLIAHSEFFFPVDTSLSLTGCIILSYRYSDVILGIFLQIIHAECFEYIMQFHTKYKLAGVPQQFSPGHGPDSFSVPKSCTATFPQQREKYCCYCFSFTPFFSQQCGQNHLLQGASSLSLFHGLVVEAGAVSNLLFLAQSIFVLHWLSPLGELFLQPWVDTWAETEHATMKRYCFGAVF